MWVLLKNIKNTRRTTPGLGFFYLMENSLKDWKVGENAGTFSIENGAYKVNGPVAHLFYDGTYQEHNFKNFEFKADVMTLPGSNSGLYFHIKYQEEWMAE